MSNTNKEGLKISDLKNQLFKMRFQLSRIVNISPAGPFYTEFLLYKEYLESFKNKCSMLGIACDGDYDPSVPFNPAASQEIRTRIRDRFINRITKTIERTQRAEVREYYCQWLEQARSQESDASAPTKRPLEIHPTGMSPLTKAQRIDSVEPVHYNSDEETGEMPASSSF
jgi:hypothetical protein